MYIPPSRLFTDTSSNFERLITATFSSPNYYFITSSICQDSSIWSWFSHFICLFLHCWRLNPQPHMC